MVITILLLIGLVFTSTYVSNAPQYGAGDFLAFLLLGLSPIILAVRLIFKKMDAQENARKKKIEREKREAEEREKIQNNRQQLVSTLIKIIEKNGGFTHIYFIFEGFNDPMFFEKYNYVKKIKIYKKDYSFVEFILTDNNFTQMYFNSVISIAKMICEQIPGAQYTVNKKQKIEHTYHPSVISHYQDDGRGHISPVYYDGPDEPDKIINKYKEVIIYSSDAWKERQRQLKLQKEKEEKIRQL